MCKYCVKGGRIGHKAQGCWDSRRNIDVAISKALDMDIVSERGFAVSRTKSNFTMFHLDLRACPSAVKLSTSRTKQSFNSEWVSGHDFQPKVNDSKQGYRRGMSIKPGMIFSMGEQPFSGIWVGHEYKQQQVPASDQGRTSIDQIQVIQNFTDNRLLGDNVKVKEEDLKNGFNNQPPLSDHGINYDGELITKFSASNSNSSPSGVRSVPAVDTTLVDIQNDPNVPEPHNNVSSSLMKVHGLSSPHMNMDSVGTTASLITVNDLSNDVIVQSDHQNFYSCIEGNTVSKEAVTMLDDQKLCSAVKDLQAVSIFMEGINYPICLKSGRKNYLESVDIKEGKKRKAIIDLRSICISKLDISLRNEAIDYICDRAKRCRTSSEGDFVTSKDIIFDGVSPNCVTPTRLVGDVFRIDTIRYGIRYGIRIRYAVYGDDTDTGFTVKGQAKEQQKMEKGRLTYKTKDTDTTPSSFLLLAEMNDGSTDFKVD